MMAETSHTPHPEHIPEGKRAKSPLSGTCSGGGKGMLPPEPFSTRCLFWAGEIVGAVSIFVILFSLLFIGAALQ